MSALPSDDVSARKRHALAMFAGLPQHYDLVAAGFSFGQDPRWRSRMVTRLAPGPTDRVLDVACGTGLVTEALVRAGAGEVVGLDQSDGMLEGARQRLSRKPELAARVNLVRGQAESLPFADGEFDGLTFTYLLRYVDDPAATLRELARVVKPGGRIASLEFAVPPQPAIRALWHAYCRIGLPTLGRLVSRQWYEAGQFLGPSISGFYDRHPLEEVIKLWGAAGIDAVRTERMSVGGGVVMSGVRR